MTGGKKGEVTLNWKVRRAILRKRLSPLRRSQVRFQGAQRKARREKNTTKTSKWYKGSRTGKGLIGKGSKKCAFKLGKFFETRRPNQEGSRPEKPTGASMAWHERKNAKFLRG